MAKLHFLNVGEGDCSIIQHNDGTVSMIDVCCGNLNSEEIEKSFSCESFVGVKGNFNQKATPTNPIDYLKALNVGTIFRYIQTHPDMDHMDGLLQLKNNYTIVNFWDTKNSKEQSFDESGKSGKYKKDDWDCYQTLRNSKNNPLALFYTDGDSKKYFAYDENGKKTDDYLQILSPTTALLAAANKSGDWNDSSYVILYRINGYKVLFCGDAKMKTINHLLLNHINEISNLDVLIAPHHGRDGNMDFSFLDVMNPKVTLFGNAQSKDLAYNAWNNKKLFHITNNQAGDILLDFLSTGIEISVSNKTFADSFNMENWKQSAGQSNMEGFGMLCRLNK